MNSEGARVHACEGLTERVNEFVANLRATITTSVVITAAKGQKAPCNATLQNQKQPAHSSTTTGQQRGSSTVAT